VVFSDISKLWIDTTFFVVKATLKTTGIDARFSADVHLQNLFFYSKGIFHRLHKII